MPLVPFIEIGSTGETGWMPCIEVKILVVLGMLTQVSVEYLSGNFKEEVEYIGMELRAEI